MSTKDPLSGLGENSAPEPRKYTGKFAVQGTKATGFEGHGPYHCEDCIHMDNAGADGNKAHGCCYHPAVMNDPEVVKLDLPDGTPADKRKQKDGSILVQIERECCGFVNQPAEHDDDQDEDDDEAGS